MPPTIIDVARRAGVSPGTVSNALSGKRPVSAATRERIYRAIEELGYKPNRLARSLVSRRSYLISVVITELQDLGLYGYASTLTGLQQRANRLGYSLLLHFITGPANNPLATLSEISTHRVDGIIWAIHEFAGNRDWLNDVSPAQYPPIVFLHMHPDPNLTVVAVDNRAGARMATQHLVEQGCRAIGLIAGPLDWWESQERLAGWREAMEQAGLDAPDSLVVEGNWLSESGQQGMATLLARRPDIDGVFACNDVMALGALHTAYSRGIRVPDDLLLVGYDNVPEAAAYWPPLTSVRQGLKRVGWTAMETLHQIIEAGQNNRPAPVQTLLRPELVVRRSSIRWPVVTG